MEGTPPEPVSRVTVIVEDMGVPKGSFLIWTDEFGRDVRLPVGRLEGLAVHINGTDLPEEVYRTCDINFVVERMDALMEGIGRQYSYWEGEQETSLYFYGTSYEKMLEASAGLKPVSRRGRPETPSACHCANPSSRLSPPRRPEAPGRREREDRTRRQARRLSYLVTPACRKTQGHGGYVMQKR